VQENHKKDLPMNEAASRPVHPKGEVGKFTVGSIMRHVVVMSASGAIGLIAIFAVDLLSLLYISWLGNINFTAGVGYATAVMFFSTSANVGLMIGLAALVSRSLGAGDRERARRLAGSATVTSVIASAFVAAFIMAVLHPLLTVMGATGDTHDVAYRFLMIAMPSNVLLGWGMSLSGILRSVGDAKRSMFVTLSGGIASVFIDPILIFGLGLGTDGAAIATIISRLVFCVMGYYGAVRVHNLVKQPTAMAVVEDFLPLLAIALPAVLTNLAAPVAGAFMNAVLSPFGDEAIAANAIITRLVPVAFGFVFALSAAVGPIISQNLGARNIARVRRTLVDSLIVTAAAVVLAWVILALARNGISFVFHAKEGTADLVSFFCLVIAGTWIFHGALFVANASFNNLGAPALATAFNWGKSTLGTIPFALVGVQMGGVKGALIGQGIGALLFGIGGVYAAFRVVAMIERRWNLEAQ